MFFLNTSAYGSVENYFYEVQYGNLIVGRAEVSIKTSSNKIELNSRSKTAGFLDVFYEYVGELNTSSIRENNIWVPQTFLAKGVFNNKTRSSSLRWSINNSISYKNVPIIDLKKFHPIDKENLENVLDPITAFINVIEKISSKKKCDASLEIFDGRRQYNLKIKTLLMTNALW